jgi:hypothetical protein
MVDVPGEPGRIGNEKTLNWMYEEGIYDPDELLPALLFSHGFSNGAAFWRTDCLSDLQIGGSTRREGIQESLRLLRLRDPVYVSLQPTSVWRPRDPQKSCACRKPIRASFWRLASNGIQRVMAEKEGIDCRCAALRRLGEERVLNYIARNTIPDFFRYHRVVSIERTMLLCGYNTKLTSRRQADRLRLMYCLDYSASWIDPRGICRRLSARHLADRSPEHGTTSSYPPRMRLTPRSALLVLLFSLFIASTWDLGSAATSYYFSASGSDSNNCRSPASPCRTIGKMNSLTYAAGDSILFHGGDSFTGCVMLNSTNVPNKGSASNPITLDSYGSGNATLLSNCPGNLHALLTIDGVSGVTVQNLILSANGTQTAIGIMVQNSYTSTAVNTILIQNNDISGFNISGPGQYGAEIFIAGQAYATGGNCGPLNNVQVLNNKLHGAAGPTSPDDNGITGSGCGANVTNVKYSGNEVFNIGGHGSAPGGTSGNGIVANSVDGGELSFNLVHDNGANVNTCGGPAGVWAYKANNITIKFNEVYHMQPLPLSGGCDWAAYDLDEGVSNSIVEYNYSHDNAGAAILIYNAAGPNTVRYNVSENDNNLGTNGTGAFALSATGVAYIHNNTVYRTGVFNNITPACYSLGNVGTFPAGYLLANNLCVIPARDSVYGTSRYVDVNGADVTAVTIANNMYYNPNGEDRWQINGSQIGLATVQAHR